MCGKNCRFGNFEAYSDQSGPSRAATDQSDAGELVLTTNGEGAEVAAYLGISATMRLALC